MNQDIIIVTSKLFKDELMEMMAPFKHSIVDVNDGVILCKMFDVDWKDVKNQNLLELKVFLCNTPQNMYFYIRKESDGTVQNILGSPINFNIKLDVEV